MSPAALILRGCVASAPGTVIVVKPPLLYRKPYVFPSAPVYGPTISPDGEIPPVSIMVPFAPGTAKETNLPLRNRYPRVVAGAPPTQCPTMSPFALFPKAHDIPVASG